MFNRNSSLWQYEIHGDIRGGSLERRQSTMGAPCISRILDTCGVVDVQCMIANQFFAEERQTRRILLPNKSLECQTFNTGILMKSVNMTNIRLDIYVSFAMTYSFIFKDLVSSIIVKH